MVPTARSVVSQLPVHSYVAMVETARSDVTPTSNSYATMVPTARSAVSQLPVHSYVAMVETARSDVSPLIIVTQQWFRQREVTLANFQYIVAVVETARSDLSPLAIVT